MRRRVDLSRLRAALHIASNDQDDIAVGETIFVGVEAMRTSGKVDDLILANSDLSAAFLEETIGNLVLNNPDERSRQGSVLFHLAREKAKQGKPFESRLNLQAAEEWMQQIFKDEDQRHVWSTQKRDVVTRLATIFSLRGWSVVEQDCGHWTPPSFRVALRKWVLAKIVVEFGPSVITRILSELDSRYHFLAINSLCRAGVAPTPKQREQALIGLAKFDFKELEKDKGYGSEPSLTAELESEMLFFLEGLVQAGEITNKKSRLVLGKLPSSGLQEFRKLHISYPYPIDFSFRVAILNALSNNEKPDLGAVFPKPKRPQEQSRKARKNLSSRKSGMTRLVGFSQRTKHTQLC